MAVTQPSASLQSPPQDQPALDTATVVAIAALLAMLAAGGAAAASAAVVTAGIVAALRSLGAPRAVAVALTEQSDARPVPLPTPALDRIPHSGPYSYRAAYLLNAARRVTRDVASGTSLTDALATERPFWTAHLAAQQARQQAAARLGAAVAAHGLLLGWKSARDSRVTPECSNADGKNFYADRPPAIGLPGALGPHPHCRCRPIAPFPNAPTLR